MTTQTYTPDMVTDETVAEFWRIYRANSQTEVSPCTKTALRAIMAPLWAEVKQLREQLRLAASTEDQDKLLRAISAQCKPLALLPAPLQRRIDAEIGGKQ